MYQTVETGRRGTSPRVGDMLSRASFFPAEHSAVYLGAYGPYPHSVLDIQKSMTNPSVAFVRLCGWSEFADGKGVTLHPVEGANVGALLSRARRLLNVRRVSYDLLGWGQGRVNCEHVATWVATGEATSRQADAGTAVLVGVGALAALGLIAAAVGGAKDDEGA